MFGLGLTVVFIALNGFFVAAEFALVKLRATRGAESNRSGRSNGVSEAVEKLDSYLGVTQLGITLASLGLGWVGEPAVAQYAEQIIVRLTGRELGRTGQGIVLGIAFALLTLGHVLFGELVPKLIAIQRSRQTAIVSVPLLRLVHLVLYPALWLLERTSRAVLKLIGLPFDAYNEGALSQDEILAILAANVARGPRGAEKNELLRRVVRFSERATRSAMIPRVDVVSLPLKTTGEAALEVLRQQRYSRVLLLKGHSLDEVAGYLHAKDLIFDPNAHRLTDLTSVVREVLFIPETQELVQALLRMQTSQCMFAVVVDEYGGTSGIITMEDLVEEIVGEIQDEFDDEGQRIERKGDTWEIDGRVLLDELRVTGMEVSDVDRHKSVGAAVMEQLERLPRVGDKVTFHGVTVEVLAVLRRRIVRVRLRQAAA